KHLTGWFGRKRRSKELIKNIRRDLDSIRKREDVSEASVREKSISASQVGASLTVGAGNGTAALASGVSSNLASSSEIERAYSVRNEKLRELDDWLPRLKAQIRDFFEISGGVHHIFLHIDDLYHLRREDQPFVVDYVHRLCKDLPIFFKIATLRHASVLYADSRGQPIGAQE